MDEDDRAGVRQGCPDTAGQAGPRQARVLWVHLLGARVPLPVPYPYTPSQLPVSVLGPQELPLLIMVQNGLLVSVGGPVGGAGHPSPTASWRGRERGALYPRMWWAHGDVSWPLPQVSLNKLCWFVGCNFRRECCSGPRWAGPAGLTLSSPRVPFLPQTEGQEDLSLSLSSCFLSGVLELDRVARGLQGIGPGCGHSMAPPGAELQGGLAQGVPGCVCAPVSVWDPVERALCVSVQVSLGERAFLRV